MTVQELYDWAIANGVKNCEIIINDSNGDISRLGVPTIWTYGDNECEVALLD